MGTPGEPVRQFMDASEAVAAAQLREGEQLVEVDGAAPGMAIQGGGTIAAYVRPAPPLDELKAVRGAEVGAALTARIDAGLLFGGLHVQIDDGARGNLIGLVAMATLVAQGITTWPVGYSRGWVTAEGPRIQLPTPADGVQLALAASAYYSGLVQHAQDLVNSIRAATDEAELDGVDIAAGWPS